MTDDGKLLEALRSVNIRDYLTTSNKQDVKTAANDAFNKLHDEFADSLVARAALQVVGNALQRHFNVGDYKTCVDLGNQALNRFRKHHLGELEDNIKEHVFRAQEQINWKWASDKSLPSEESIERLGKYVTDYDKPQYSQFSIHYIDHLAVAKRVRDWKVLLQLLHPVITGLEDPLDGSDGSRANSIPVGREGRDQINHSDAIAHLHAFAKEYPRTPESVQARSIATRLLHSMFAASKALAPDLSVKDLVRIIERETDDSFVGVLVPENTTDDIVVLREQTTGRNTPYLRPALVGPPEYVDEYRDEQEYTLGYERMEELLKNYDWNPEILRSFATAAERIGLANRRSDRAIVLKSLVNLVTECSAFRRPSSTAD